MQEYGEVTHASLDPNHCLDSLTDPHLAKYWPQVDDSNTHTVLVLEMLNFNYLRTDDLGTCFEID